KYKVIAEYKGVKDSVELNVVMDPRIPVPTDALIAQREMIDDLTSKIEVLYKGTQQLIESKGITDKVSAQIDGVKGDETKELQNSVKAVKDSINAVQDNIFGKQNAETQGITSRENNSVTGRIQSALRYINSRPGKPTLTEEKLVKEATELISKAVENINRFYVNVWPEFREKVENTEIPLFKDYDLLELNE
ncbi:MAG: hypothetical protein HQ541_03065, partial [Mariniphaga sp.]|nr:hypothetical protein [Mariniphaga sp.]